MDGTEIFHRRRTTELKGNWFRRGGFVVRTLDCGSQVSRRKRLPDSVTGSGKLQTLNTALVDFISVFRETSVQVRWKNKGKVRRFINRDAKFAGSFQRLKPFHFAFSSIRRAEPAPRFLKSWKSSPLSRLPLEESASTQIDPRSASAESAQYSYLKEGLLSAYPEAGTGECNADQLAPEADLPFSHFLRFPSDAGYYYYYYIYIN